MKPLVFDAFAQDQPIAAARRRGLDVPGIHHRVDQRDAEAARAAFAQRLRPHAAGIDARRIVGQLEAQHIVGAADAKADAAVALGAVRVADDVRAGFVDREHEPVAQRRLDAELVEQLAQRVAHFAKVFRARRHVMLEQHLRVVRTRFFDQQQRGVVDQLEMLQVRQQRAQARIGRGCARC